MEIQRELKESNCEWREQCKKPPVEILNIERTPQKKWRRSLSVDAKKSGETSETSSSDVDDNCFYYGPEKRANSDYKTKKDEELINSPSAFFTESLTSPANISQKYTSSDSPETSSDELIYKRTRSNDNCPSSRITRKKKTALIKAFGWWQNKSGKKKKQEFKEDQTLRPKYKASTSFCTRQMERPTKNEFVKQNASDGFDGTTVDLTNISTSPVSSEDEFMVIPPAGSPTVTILSQDRNNNNNIVSSAAQINNDITRSQDTDKHNCVKRRKVLPLLIIKKRKSQCENPVSNIRDVALNCDNVRNNIDFIQNVSLSNTVVNQELKTCNDIIDLKRKSELLENCDLKRSKSDCDNTVVPENVNHNIRISELNKTNHSDDSKDFTGFIKDEQTFSLQIHSKVVANLEVQIKKSFSNVQKPIQTDSRITENIAHCPKKHLFEMFPRLASNQKHSKKIFSIDYDVRHIELLNKPIFHPLYLKAHLRVSYNLKHNRHLFELKEIPEKYTKHFSLVEYFSSHRILCDPIKRVLLLVERFSKVILRAEMSQFNDSEDNRLRLYTTTKTEKDLCDTNNVIKIVPDDKFHAIDEVYILKVTLDEKSRLKASVPTFIRLEDLLNIPDSENLINWDDKESVVSFANAEINNYMLINNLYDIPNNEESCDFNPEIFKLLPEKSLLNIIDPMSSPTENLILKTDCETSCERLKTSEVLPKLPNLVPTEHRSILKTVSKRKNDQEDVLEFQSKSKVAKYLENNTITTETLTVPPFDSTTKIILDPTVESEATSEDTNAVEITERPEKHVTFPASLIATQKSSSFTQTVFGQSQTASKIINASENLERFQNNKIHPEIRRKQEVFGTLQTFLEVINLPEISKCLENKSTRPENVNITQIGSPTKDLLQTIDGPEVLEHLQNTVEILEIIESQNVENISILLERTSIHFLNQDSILNSKNKEDTVITLHSNKIPKTECTKLQSNMICTKPNDSITLSPQKTNLILNQIFVSINKIASILMEHEYCVKILEFTNDEFRKIKSALKITSNISSILTSKETNNLNINYSHNIALKFDFTYLHNEWRKFNYFNGTPEIVFQRILLDTQPVIRRQPNEDTVNYEISFKKRCSSDKLFKAVKHVLENKNYNQTHKEELLNDLGRANEKICANNESLSKIEDMCREKIFEPKDSQCVVPNIYGSEDLIELDTTNVKKIELLPEDVELNAITNVSEQIETIEEINLVENYPPKIKTNELSENDYEDVYNKYKTTDSINRKSGEEIEIINDSKKKVKELTAIDLLKTNDKDAKVRTNNETYEAYHSSKFSTEIDEDLSLSESGSVSECDSNEDVSECSNDIEGNENIFASKSRNIFQALLNGTSDIISRYTADINKSLNTTSSIKKIKGFNRINDFYTQNVVFIVQNIGADITKILDIVVYLTLFQSQSGKKRISALVITSNYIYIQLTYNNSKHTEQFYISIVQNKKYKIFEISGDMQQYRKKAILKNDSELHKFIKNYKKESVQKYIDLPPQITVDLQEIQRLIFKENKFSHARNRTTDIMHELEDSDDDNTISHTKEESKEYTEIEKNKISISEVANTDEETVKYIGTQKPIENIHIAKQIIAIDECIENAMKELIHIDFDEIATNLNAEEENETANTNYTKEETEEKKINISKAKNINQESAEYIGLLEQKPEINVNANIVEDDDENISFTTEDLMNESIYIEDDKNTITAQEEITTDNEKEYLCNYDSVINKIKSWASNISSDIPSIPLSCTTEMSSNIKQFVEVVMRSIQPNNFSDSCIKDDEYNIEGVFQKQAKLTNLIPVQLEQCSNHKFVKKTKNDQNIFSYMHKYIMMSRIITTINQNQIHTFIFRPIFENKETYEVYEIEVRKGNRAKVFLFKVDKILDIENNDESIQDNIEFIEQHNFELKTPDMEENKAPTTVKYDFKTMEESVSNIENDSRIKGIVNAEKELLREENMDVEKINLFTEEVDKNVTNKCENTKNMDILYNIIEDDEDSGKLIIDMDAENTDLEENINGENTNKVEEILNTLDFLDENISNPVLIHPKNNSNNILQSLHKLETNKKIKTNCSEILQNSIGENLAQNATVPSQNDTKINDYNWPNNVMTVNRNIPKINILNVEILKSSKIPSLQYCRETVIVKNTNRNIDSVNDISNKTTVSEFNLQNTSADKNEINTSKNILQKLPKRVDEFVEKPFMQENLNIPSCITPIIGKNFIQKKPYSNLRNKDIHKSTVSIGESKSELDLILGINCDVNAYKLIDQITTKTGLTITRIPTKSETGLTVTKIPQKYESNIEHLNIAQPLNKETLNHPNFSGNQKTNTKDIKRKRSLNELIEVLVNKASKSVKNDSNNNPSSSRNNNSNENKIVNIPHSIRNILNLDNNDKPIDNNKLSNCANKNLSELVKIDEKSNKHIDKKTKNISPIKPSEKQEHAEKVYVKTSKEFEENLRILCENNAKQMFIFYWFIRNIRNLKKKPMYDLPTFFKMLKNGELKYYKAHFENYFKFRVCQNN